ncbi:MAG: hypothetical protein NZ518_07005, partial [Dehalococcoidia bacterium]|nr:hypothetical protein [Dehalococcoidia bacterium]
DEVYVRIGAFRSETKKLNDGQSHRFEVPLANLMLFDRAATVEVYDEDLGWFFDRDDLIVKMLWQPPFAETTNSKSFDEADYRVKVHV